MMLNWQRRTWSSVAAGSQQFPHDGLQLLRHRANYIFHQGIQGGGGFNHFPGHQLAAPGRHPFVKEAEDNDLDKGVQTVRRGDILTDIAGEQGVFLPGRGSGRIP